MKIKITLILFAFTLASAVALADDDFRYSKKPDTSSSDTNFPVESFGGTFDVSSLGAATYTVPIDVPVGVGGMQPNLSITYNSQSSFGLLGLGFNLSGLSSITRGPKSVWQDGISSGITFDSDCALYLDGERLISEKNGEYSLASNRLVRVRKARILREVSNKDESDRTIVESNGNKKTYKYYKYVYVFEVVSADETVSTYECLLPYTRSDKTCEYSWVLTSVVDKFGNTMTVDYLVDKDNWYVYPKSFTYGKNTVSIVYEDLNSSLDPEVEHHYFSFDDKKGELTRRIQKIVSKTNNDVYRKYEFSYSKSYDSKLYTSYSKLYDITKYNGSDEKCFPIYFRWKEKPFEKKIATKPIDVDFHEFGKHDEYSFDGKKQYVTVDVNGDGVSDFIEIKAVTHKSTQTKHTSLIVYPSSIDETGNVRYLEHSKPIILEGEFDSKTFDWDVKNSYSVNYADFNGDGIMDLFIPFYTVHSDGKYVDSDYTYHMNYYVLYGARNLSNIRCSTRPAGCLGDGLTKNFTSTNIPEIDCSSKQANSYLIPGVVKKRLRENPPLYASYDIDNDGKGNILILEPYKANEYGYRCYIETPNSQGGFDTHVCFLELDKNYPRYLFVNDYNKDGMLDIMVVCDYDYLIFYNKGKDNAYFSQKPSIKGESLKGYDVLMREGDFDGDGIADYFCVDGEIWSIAYGNADGTFDTKSVFHFDVKYEAYNKHQYAVCVFDADGDGRSDVMVSAAKYEKDRWGNRSNPKTFTYLYRSSGSRTDTRYQNPIMKEYTRGGFREDGADAVNWSIGDFTGDGRPELFHYSENTDIVWFTDDRLRESPFMIHGIWLDQKTDKIISVTDAMENTIEIDYESLTDRKNYSDGKEEGFPLVEHVIPMDVVSSVTRSNGILPSSYVEYQYKGLKYHSQGRGVLGFEEITSESKVQKSNESFAPKSKTVSRIDSYDSQFYTPAKTVAETYVWSTGKNDYELYNSSSIEYQTEAVGDKGNYFHHPVRKAVTDLYGHTSYIDYEYDAQNYVLKSEDAYSDDGEGGMDKAVVYFYPTVKDKNYKGALKPCEIQTAQKHADDKNMFCVKTKLEYDENGLLVKKIDNYGTDKALTTLMDYDYVGNLSETKILGSDVKTKIVSNVYDKSHRFLILTYTEYEETPNTATLHKYDKWGHCTYTANFDNFIPDDYDENAAEEDIVGATSFVRNEYDSWGNLVRSVDTFNNVKTVTKGWGDSQEKKYYVLTQGTHTPWVKTWYDSMGREVETESVGAKDIALSTKTKYDELGNVVERESKIGDRKVTEFVTYDDYGRVVKTESSTGEVTTTIYDDRSVAVTTGKKTVTKTLDSWGNPKSVNDGFCEITYTYNSNGKPSKVVAGDDVTTFEYDEVGNKTSMKTSDRGTITYKYNSMGECIYTNECGRVYQTTGFDEQGRVTEKKVGAYVVKYRYGTSDEDVNKLVEKALYDPSNKLVSKTSYYYDEYGRVEQEEKYIAKTGNSFWTDYTYNQFGELNSVNGITYEYDCYGNKVDVLSVSQRQTGPGIYEDVKKTLWHMSKNKGKSCEATLFGDGGLKSEYTYDDAGRLTNSLVSYRGSSICSLGYEYDKNTGNMTTRSGMMGKTEKFFYDDLDRLNVYCSLDGRTQSVDYSGSGNIIYKSDVGTYRYQYLFKPNCLTQLDNEEGACPLDTREISYNVWNRVSKIKDTASGYELQFEYDEDGNRIWSKLTKNGVWIREIEYAGNVEHIMTNTSDDYFTYLGDNLVCHGNDFTSEILYLCTDHLGSIVKIVDEQGNACFEAKYDAWGNQKIIKNDIGFIRGYTGHEEMTDFGLINMNARLYDPLLGRFISADDYVQMPENSQNFNRYAYCVNNPLKYSDPSGNFVFPAVLAVAAIVSFECGLTSWAMNRDFGTGAVQGFTTIMFSQGISGTQVIGEGFGHNVGSLWNEAFRAGFHGLWQGFNGQMDGGDFKTDFLAGFVSSLTGSVVGGGNLVTLGATTLSGGLVELAFDGTGNAFLRGAKIGFEIGALNHCGKDDNESSVEYLRRSRVYCEDNSQTRSVNKTKWALEMFNEWRYGTGESEVVHINDPIAKSFKYARKVKEAREFFYNKYKNVKNLTDAFVTDFAGSFGLSGLYNAGFDPVQQFVGSYDVDILSIRDGKQLMFIIRNETTVKSFFYHVVPFSWERSSFPIMGTTRQVYIFTEPVRNHW